MIRKLYLLNSFVLVLSLVLTHFAQADPIGEVSDVTARGDFVQGVPNDGDWPRTYRLETPEMAIDDDIETKYLHYKGDFDPDPGTGGAGFQVTPLVGPTIVTGLTFTTANDFPGRDPIAFELSGSNAGIDGPFELIASGDIVDFAQALAWPRLAMNITPILFDNDTAYAHYQLIFTAIRGPVGGSINSMQIAEVELLGVPAPVSGHIILVTQELDWDLDGLRDDHALESFLVSEGHHVDVRPDYWKVLTPDKIAELNAADLIIFSRLAWSSSYDEGNEITDWNSLTTPLLQMSAYFAQHIRWKWVNSGVRAEIESIHAVAMRPNHPVFWGIPLTAYDPTAPDGPLNVVQAIDPLVGTGLTSFIGGTNMGNGQLIAKPQGQNMGWIAEWDAGVEFFDGSGQYSGGKRMLFCAGTQEIQYYDYDRQEVATTAQGELNLTAEGLQMFRNAIAYLLLPEPGIPMFPIPADGARIGNRTPVLRWNPGVGGVEYDVYFGTDFDRVNRAHLRDTSGIYRGRWAENCYFTEALEIGQTYYWRIDDVGMDGGVIHKGNVWSFTLVDSITIECRVCASEDDGYASNENLQNLSSDYLKVGASGFDQPPYYLSGMVFQNVEIPQGAEILSARLKIRSHNSRLTDVVYGVIEAEAADRADPFGSFRNMGILPRTHASVHWDHFVPWAKDTWYESPDIAQVIQEVIHRSGWSATRGSLVILYSARKREGGYRNISAFDRGSDNAPKLEITYVP